MHAAHLCGRVIVVLGRERHPGVDSSWQPKAFVVWSRPLRKQGMGHARQENVYSQMHAAMKPALQAQEASARRIEQGGLLVAAPPGSHTAILQMPRGNLEVVCPRPLVVAAIAHALQVCSPDGMQVCVCMPAALLSV